LFLYSSSSIGQKLARKVGEASEHHSGRDARIEEPHISDAWSDFL
jgi:hypothetical protein